MSIKSRIERLEQSRPAAAEMPKSTIPVLSREEWIAVYTRGERIDRPDFYEWLERLERRALSIRARLL